FDYVGVIFGTDLTYDLDEQTWVGHKDVSCDTVVKRSKDQFLDLVKNTYRVLLTRGMLGCYVHFMDKDTERFVKSRMEAPRQG
ncbi:MAG: DNA/RNA helicase domain-containing protein, partial [Candidatus Eisenbacteria bacterium]